MLFRRLLISINIYAVACGENYLSYKAINLWRRRLLTAVLLVREQFQENRELTEKFVEIFFLI